MISTESGQGPMIGFCVRGDELYRGVSFLEAWNFLPITATQNRNFATWFIWVG